MKRKDTEHLKDAMTVGVKERLNKEPSGFRRY